MNPKQIPLKAQGGRLALLATSLVLAACQAAPLALGPDGSPMGSSAGLPVVGGALATTPLSPPDVSVSALAVETLPLPGGATYADLLADNNPYDAVDPEVPVRFSAADHAADGAATNAVLRVRGKSTRDTEQKSFRIALGKGVKAWRGLEDVLLNKHPYDHSRMRNRLSFDLFQGLKDIPAAPKASFATLSVDGKDLGFFTQIERVDKAFLKRHGLDEAGWLYKAENFEFLRYAEELKLASTPGYSKASFEKRLEIYGSKDHAPLLAMLDAVVDAKQPIREVVAKHFEWDNLLTSFAMNVLCDNTDTNSQNFYLYRSTTDARWRFIPWDFDGAWGFYPPDADRSGREGPLGRSHEGAANWWNMGLHRRLLRDPAFREALVGRMQALAEGYLTTARLQGLLEAYRPVVRAAILKPVDADGVAAMGLAAGPSFDAEVASILKVVPKAQERFLASLKRPMPFFLGESPERQGAEVAFSWDASESLVGRPIRYTLLVAKDPSLKDVVLKREGLEGTEARVPLPAGTYFWSVEARQDDGEWMIPFDAYEDPSGKPFQGVLRSQL